LSRNESRLAADDYGADLALIDMIALASTGKTNDDFIAQLSGRSSVANSASRIATGTRRSSRRRRSLPIGSLSHQLRTRRASTWAA